LVRMADSSATGRGCGALRMAMLLFSWEIIQ
jgi:hypothetical protein